MSDPGRSDVFAEERQDHIARIVEEHGRARVADLAATFRVSGVTIRKDLAVLERQGRIVRTHGGAMTVGRAGAERAFDVRERLQRDEKDAIGREAAAMVVDGDSIALDASTTALALARHLKGRGGWLHLTVITNGLRIASELAGHPGISVVMPAGFLRWEALSLVGPLGEGLFDKVNIQKAFMGAAGFAIEAGLSDATEEEAQIKRLMVEGANEVVGLVDHTKWERAAFATFCKTADLDAVVTDAGAPAAMMEDVRRLGIDVRQVEPTAQGAPGSAARRVRTDGATPW
jgi:DeoR family transcriptional regulator of aga operon/DeoR family fructose operon transcriptional repressor